MNKKESNTRRIIFDYIGHHPEYGQHPNVCHICGNNCDATGKFIFEGSPGAVWEGEYFEFSICTYCFYEELSNAMDKMDSVMLQRQIDKKKEGKSIGKNTSRSADYGLTKPLFHS